MTKRSIIFALALVVLSISVTQVFCQIILKAYSLSISADPTAVTVGEEITVTGRLTYILVIPPVGQPGKTIDIQSRREGEATWNSIGNSVTNEVGNYNFAWTTSQEGAFEVRAVWGTYVSSVVTVRVNARFPIELALGAVAAVAVVIVVLIIFLKKRPKKPKPTKLKVTADPKEISADRRSVSTLTVELLDQDGNPIKSGEDREVSLYVSEGTAAEKVTIQKGESSVTTALTSSEKIGKVAVSASSKRLQDSRTEVTFKEKKRYCMHCGERMPFDALSCPRCGNTPPSGLDTKVCSNCGEVIPIVAKYCSECGASQPT